MKQDFNAQQNNAVPQKSVGGAPVCPVKQAALELVDVFAAEEASIYHRLKDEKDAFDKYEEQNQHWGIEIADDLNLMETFCENMTKGHRLMGQTLVSLNIKLDCILTGIKEAQAGKDGRYPCLSKSFAYDDAVLPGFSKEIDIYKKGQLSGRTKCMILRGIFDIADLRRVIDHSLIEGTVSRGNKPRIFHVAKKLYDVSNILCDMIDVPKVISDELNALSPSAERFSPSTFLARYYVRFSELKSQDPPKDENKRESDPALWSIGYPF